MNKGKWPLQSTDIELIKRKMLETFEPSNNSFIPCEQLESEIKPSYMHKTYFFRILKHLGYNSIRKQWHGKRGVSGYQLKFKINLKEIIRAMTGDPNDGLVNMSAITMTAGEEIKKGMPIIAGNDGKAYKYQSFQGLIKDNKEAAALLLSDLHFGKSTVSYSRYTASEMIKDTVERQVIIYERDNIFKRVDEYNIWFDGDIIDGQGIYPSQPHYQDESDALKQVEIAIDSIMPFVELGKRFKKLNIFVQAGNHGRTSRFAKESQNWDVLFGTMLRMRLGADIVKAVNHYTPLEIKIKNTNVLMFHGDDIRSALGIPYYGITKRAMQWRDTYNFDVLCLGHFHKAYYMPLSPNAVIVGSGTLVTDDDYSIRNYGHDGIKQTWFMTFHPSLPNKITDFKPVFYRLGVK